ncbi:MAG: hypothetical protein NTV48_00100 [Candidatus Vogelbacteria bacterium]|nr:hypothetical protein [Candidatus Vogelbacteria bacterium]
MKLSNETNSEIQPIVLTREQYLTLAKVVYLGNWIANAYRVGQKDDPRLVEYDEISDHIFSLASKFGFSKHLEHEIEFDEDLNRTETSKLIEEYDEETFWTELPERLGDRDFYARYGKEDWDKMTPDERFLKMQECVIKWENEIENNDLDRIGIIEK